MEFSFPCSTSSIYYSTQVGFLRKWAENQKGKTDFLVDNYFSIVFATHFEHVNDYCNC